MQNKTIVNNIITEFAVFEYTEWDTLAEDGCVNWDCKTEQLTDWSNTITDYTFMSEDEVDADVESDYEVVGVIGFFDSVDDCIDDYDRGTTTTFVAMRHTVVDK